MKKLIILVILFVCITGCSNVTSDGIGLDDNQTETTNLFINDSITKEENLTEDEFVTYIDSINYHVDAITEEKMVTVTDQKTLENTFITLTDFIFYNGTIKGKTFNELTTSSKEKILDIYQDIDQKIETKIPGYKQKIKDTTTKTYNNVKEKVSKLKEDIKNKYIEDYGQEKYDQVEKTYEESKELLKETAEETYDVIVDVTKDFYESTKNKAENWYKNYKESRN